MPANFKNMLRFIACLLVLPLTGICQVAPAWVADMGGPGNAISTIIKVDAQNNMYVTGIFAGTVDFDPSSSGTKNLTAASTGYDGFIAKYNPSGGLVWASSFGGQGTDQPNGLEVDINGQITITGQFDSQPMDADPGTGVFNLTAAGRDAFIIHLDGSGNFLWAKSIGGTGAESGGKVVSDASGNLVVTVQFQSTINVGGTNITPKGTKDGLLVKYDAAGNVIWKFSFGDVNDNSIIGAVIDKNDNITITGYINGTVNFNPLGAVDNVSGNNSIFIAQYSSSGILRWKTVILGTAQGADYNMNLALDAQNNIYMTGVFAAPINFGSATPLRPQGTQDMFLAKYNQNGATQFYKGIGNAGSFIHSYGIVVSPDNNIYLSGYFTGTIDFDPSAAVANVKDHTKQDMFLVKYDVNSNYKWAFGLGNNSCNNNIARSVAVDGNNDVLLSGSFCSTVNFNESGCASTTSAQSIVRDLFIAKYTASTTVFDNTIWQPTPDFPVCTATSADASPIKGSVPAGAGPFTYQWQISFDNIVFNNVNETGPDYDPAFLITKTTYFRRIVSGGICSAGTASNVITIAVTPPIINTIATPAAVTSFCGPGDPALISGSPLPGSGYNIQWQLSTDNVTFTDIDGVNTVNYDPPQITETTYYRRIITAPGCAPLPPSNVVTINIHRAITINNNSITQPLPAIFCSPSADPSVINGSAPTGGTGNFTYQWQMSTDNINFTDITGVAATSINYDPPVISTTTYYRRGVLSFCSAPLYSNVVTITVTPAVGNNTLTAPAATSFCGPAFGGDITGTSAGGAGYSYQWQQSTDNVNFTDIAGANGVTYNTGLVNTTTYYRRLVSGGACGTPSPSNVVAITISTGALARVSAGSTICAGSSVTLTASGGTKYTWTPAAGLSATNIAAPTATPLVTTTYKVIVSTGSCSDSAKVTIVVIPKPIVEAGEDKIVLKGDKIKLAGKVMGNNVQYSWSPTTYLDDPTLLNPTVTPTEDITYTLTATTDQNCAIETDKVTIKVYEKIVVPNTFTPNGDGTNDTWNIAAMTAYAGSVVTVYNRQGLPIFKSTGYTKTWDGTFKGKLLPFGTYYYVIDLKNGTKPLSGWLTIVK